MQTLNWDTATVWHPRPLYPIRTEKSCLFVTGRREGSSSSGTDTSNRDNYEFQYCWRLSIRLKDEKSMKKINESFRCGDMERKNRQEAVWSFCSDNKVARGRMFPRVPGLMWRCHTDNQLSFGFCVSFLLLALATWLHRAVRYRKQP